MFGSVLLSCQGTGQERDGYACCKHSDALIIKAFCTYRNKLMFTKIITHPLFDSSTECRTYYNAFQMVRYFVKNRARLLSFTPFRENTSKGDEDKAWQFRVGYRRFFIVAEYERLMRDRMTIGFFFDNRHFYHLILL